MRYRLILLAKLFLRVSRSASFTVSVGKSHFLRRLVLPPHVAISYAEPGAHRVAAVINSLLWIVAVVVVGEGADGNHARAGAGASHFRLQRVVTSAFFTL